jgi:hypothetical protein
VHRTVRAVPAERLLEERTQMRPLPTAMPDCDHRFVVRVPQQPYLRVDRNDYSIDPVFAGRRVEVRISQTEVVAVVLGTSELACWRWRSSSVWCAGSVRVSPPANDRPCRKRFNAWGEIFGDDMAATAMIDRLIHHAEILSLKGGSYRLRGKDLDARLAKTADIA